MKVDPSKVLKAVKAAAKHPAVKKYGKVAVGAILAAITKDITKAML